MDDKINAARKTILAALQAPINEEHLSWKPGVSFQKNTQWFMIFHPYINKEFFEQRLDEVLGSQWTAEYEKDNIGMIHCYITLTLPGEVQVKRQGIGQGATKETKPQDILDEEKGGRTSAFRDACRALGICGRDIVNTSTDWVEIVVDKLNSNNKPQYYKPAVQLNRSMLRHSGACVVAAAGAKSVAHKQVEKHGSTAVEAQSTTGLAVTDFDKIIWQLGKHKGKSLLELPQSYLEWAIANASQLDEKSSKFDQFMHDAVHARLSDMSKGQEPEPLPDDVMQKIFDGTEETPF